MLIDKEYIFHYDKTKSAWKNNSKILEHDGLPCFALLMFPVTWISMALRSVLTTALRCTL